VKTLHLQILGRVQGVGFRESMRREAERRAVTGWVRNCANGSVEAVLQGEEEAVNTLLAWAQTGPSLARVDHIALAEAEGQFDFFETWAT